jgi:hypothetical protein
MNDPSLPIGPADRPDQRLDPCVPQALLEVQVSGRMANDRVDHVVPPHSLFSIVPCLDPI